MRRLLVGLLAIGAIGSIGAAPAVPGPDLPPIPDIHPHVPDDPGEITPFPLGACVYSRDLDPDREYCVIVHDPR
jgi:hypothetical protein